MEIVETRCDLLMIMIAHRSKRVYVCVILFSTRMEYRLKDFTLPTQFHLLLPVLLYGTLTDSPIYKPAKMPRFKFPSRAIASNFDRAFLYRPTDNMPLTRGVSQK